MTFFMQRRIQKAFIPLAFILILPLWFIAREGTDLTMVAPLAFLGAVFFILDRIFKPWELDRAEKTWKVTEQKEKEDMELASITRS
jgi:hypothetical protein